MAARHLSSTPLPVKVPPLQVTLALLKPDLVAHPSAHRTVREWLLAGGFRVCRGRPVLWSLSEAESFYAEHRGRFFFRRLTGYMSSGPFAALVLAKPGAVADWRALIGPTRPVRCGCAADIFFRNRDFLLAAGHEPLQNSPPPQACRDMAMLNNWILANFFIFIFIFFGPSRARLEDPAKTLRAQFGVTDTRNSFHGSDSDASAAREIAFFFPDLQVADLLKKLETPAEPGWIGPGADFCWSDLGLDI
ncbi:MAG: nucleoside diphosphate kinase [Olpidium bornovanus]|uniref:Nucleoside diphosphate kinase n=1 Tax=Olpidium bornovanus TaxID=278681 RepID=A0A8H7ZW82_9FUNG|nr:MAG: nucleoside diphosphate kinase [Olpidium bornovanus]